jgi:hypothetical protein
MEEMKMNNNETMKIEFDKNDLVVEVATKQFNTVNFHPDTAYYVERRGSHDSFVGILKKVYADKLVFVRNNPASISTYDCGDMVTITILEFLDERFRYEITPLVPENEEVKERYVADVIVGNMKEEDDFI